MAEAVNGPCDGALGWTQFCEQEAAKAAVDFVRNFRLYITDNPSHNNQPERFAKRFVEHFLEHFELETNVRRSVEVSPGTRAHNRDGSGDRTALDRGNHSPDNIREPLVQNHSLDHDDYTDDNTSPSPKSNRSFFRRLSFKGFRKNSHKKVLIKQRSDEVELSPASTHQTPGKRLRNFLSKAGGSGEKEKQKLVQSGIEEIKRDGLVNRLIDEEGSNGKTKWEKCRLALVKTAGGFMLEIYSPPKAVKPKIGVFCFLITEARETTALEMPDRENAFVLKADRNLEYVFETCSAADMQMWLEDIKESMGPNNRNGRSLPSLQPSLHEVSDTTPILYNDHRLSRGSDVSSDNPPELPPRTPTRVGDGAHPLHLSRNSSGDMAGSPRSESGFGEFIAREPLGPDCYVDQQLREYPWFHGTLSRMEAAQLVLQHGADGHGVFLVRQSETRKGEYVLTFNFQGRAKHLRMTINNEGQCRVQHLWFQTIFDMLEHFRTHPIPLESGGTSDVTLSDYVVGANHLSPGHIGGHQGQSGGHQSHAGGHQAQGHIQGQRHSPTGGASLTSGFRSGGMVLHGGNEQGRDVLPTNSGSVRTRTESMEQLIIRDSTPPLQPQQTTLNLHGRAVENHYSFV
ncbi:SH2B adapter protein 1 [Lingula anatina]|uniref:SH2B adapter protein 1 n=2 Tax=Lingula anatina TaxID=7574 RepID=A0A1S3K1M0_LINAN|nr:SH2B adapter protein 1 [Lingula anatina]|eukprot:XP_013416525.1 SH2B adapter protein 1 [Lingula anatina]